MTPDEPPFNSREDPLSLLVHPPDVEDACLSVSPYTGRRCMAAPDHQGGHEWTDGDIWSTWPNEDLTRYAE